MCSLGCRVAVVLVFALLLQLPSSSSKFVNMTVQALEQFAEEGGFKFKKITPMPLEGDGTIRKKVSRFVVQSRSIEASVQGYSFARHLQGLQPLNWQ